MWAFVWTATSDAKVVPFAVANKKGEPVGHVAIKLSDCRCVFVCVTECGNKARGLASLLTVLTFQEENEDWQWNPDGLGHPYENVLTVKKLLSYRDNVMPGRVNLETIITKYPDVDFQRALHQRLLRLYSERPAFRGFVSCALCRFESSHYTDVFEHFAHEDHYLKLADLTHHDINNFFSVFAPREEIGTILRRIHCIEAVAQIGRGICRIAEFTDTDFRLGDNPTALYALDLRVTDLACFDRKKRVSYKDVKGVQLPIIHQHEDVPCVGSHLSFSVQLGFRIKIARDIQELRQECAGMLTDTPVAVQTRDTWLKELDVKVQIRWYGRAASNVVSSMNVFRENVGTKTHAVLHCIDVPRIRVSSLAIIETTVFCLLNNTRTAKTYYYPYYHKVWPNSYIPGRETPYEPRVAPSTPIVQWNMANSGRRFSWSYPRPDPALPLIPSPRMPMCRTPLTIGGATVTPEGTFRNTSSSPSAERNTPSTSESSAATLAATSDEATPLIIDVENSPFKRQKFERM